MSNNKIYLGIDCGTMNLVCSRSDSDEIKIIRNVFLPIDNDEFSSSDFKDVSYIENSEKEKFIIGQDAFKFANWFGQEVLRPMKSGLISADEIDAIDILTLIINDLVGDIKGKDVYCSYSIPAEAIDEKRSVTYHEKVFSRIFSSLGINNSPVNEASSIIYSECKNEGYSGIGISFGAGMCNVALLFKGIEVLKFSTARSGDWIDNSVAESLSIVSNRVTSIKEKYLDLKKGFSEETNKKRKRILEALSYYYESLINYTIKKIINEFKNNVDIELDDKLVIIISGGTSLPDGFLEMFKTSISKYELPFEITEIRSAKNPLTAVSNGLRIKTMAEISSKKIN